MKEVKQALTIAGLNSDGSQGITVDLNTFHKHQIYGYSIQAAAVAGTFDGITHVLKSSKEFFQAQVEAIREISSLDAIKTGILINEEIFPEMIEFLQSYENIPIVLDPVFVTKYGKSFLKETSLHLLKKQLLPLATIATPNFYEAEFLAQMSISSIEDEERAAQKIQAMGVENVLIKRVNLYEKSDVCRDLLLLKNGEVRTFERKLQKTHHTNGTGDYLSATITSLLAQGKEVEVAVQIAFEAMAKALMNPIDVGKDFGPVNTW